MSDEPFAGWDGPGAEPEPEPEPAAATDETPLAAEEQPEEQESEPSEQPESEPEERLFAGKYRTVEEMERSYHELERKLGQREETPLQQPQPKPDQGVINEILTMPASRLAEDAGPWDEWIAQHYPNYNPAEPADWMELKVELRGEIREARARVEAERQQLQTLDQQVTTAFAAKFPQVMGNPALEAAARAVTGNLWQEIQDGTRRFEGPEAFAALIGETLTQAFGAVGPQAMGAYNARQATQRRAAVPPGGVTPAAPAQKAFDPDKYRGWNGPRD